MRGFLGDVSFAVFEHDEFAVLEHATRVLILAYSFALRKHLRLTRSPIAN